MYFFFFLIGIFEGCLFLIKFLKNFLMIEFFNEWNVIIVKFEFFFNKFSVCISMELIELNLLFILILIVWKIVLYGFLRFSNLVGYVDFIILVNFSVVLIGLFFIMVFVICLVSFIFV